ncbi:hypothetical protein PCO31010_00788 [Pandoraea commovens]|uniref:Uncharacterized protein n=1 Tax=Pandoraea commovens TaxID=2508289 RepID=A0A5E4SJ77_9BURK|nr:hypothetical protein [Pandoraea sputorum]VVD74288.1 hypothetical protein PCO31010_00788 [Pandoraea commovens]
MVTTIHCQFSDATEQSIIAVFGTQQDPGHYPSQGAIPSDDERYIAYFDSLGSSMQQYMIKPGE